MKRSGLAFLLCTCACAAQVPPVRAFEMTRWTYGATSQSVSFIGGANETESTAFRLREDGTWDEVAVPSGETRFTFRVTKQEPGAIYLTDPGRNDGLSLVFNLERRVIELQEAPGREYYDRYVIVALH